MAQQQPQLTQQPSPDQYFEIIFGDSARLEKEILEQKERFSSMAQNSEACLNAVREVVRQLTEYKRSSITREEAQKIHERIVAERDEANQRLSEELQNRANADMLAAGMERSVSDGFVELDPADFENILLEEQVKAQKARKRDTTQKRYDTICRKLEEATKTIRVTRDQVGVLIMQRKALEVVLQGIDILEEQKEQTRQYVLAIEAEVQALEAKKRKIRSGDFKLMIENSGPPTKRARQLQAPPVANNARFVDIVAGDQPQRIAPPVDREVMEI